MLGGVAAAMIAAGLAWQDPPDWAYWPVVGLVYGGFVLAVFALVFSIVRRSLAGIVVACIPIVLATVLFLLTVDFQ